MDLSDRGICPARMASICKFASVCLYLYLFVFSFYCICLWICLIGAFARHEWHPWRELLPGELSATDFAVVFACICIFLYLYFIVFVLVLLSLDLQTAVGFSVGGDAYLIFVIFFTRTKFLENKIYTEKTRKLRQNTQ